MNIDNIDSLINSISKDLDKDIAKRLNLTGRGDIANVDSSIRYRLEYIKLLDYYKTLSNPTDVLGEFNKVDILDKSVIDSKLATLVSNRIRTLGFKFLDTEHYNRFKLLSQNWFTQFLCSSVDYKGTLQSNISILLDILDSSLTTCYNNAIG